MSWGLVAGAVIGGGVSYLASEKASKRQTAAINDTAGISADFRDRLVSLQERIFEEETPARQAALETNVALSEAARRALPTIEEDILREPGTGTAFRTALSRGTEALSEEFGRFGLVDSSVFRRDASRFAEGLLAKDISNLRESRFRLAGLGPNVRDPNLTLTKDISSLTSDLSNLQLGEGLVGANQARNTGDILGGVVESVASSFFNNGSGSKGVTFSDNFQSGGFSLQ